MNRIFASVCLAIMTVIAPSCLNYDTMTEDGMVAVRFRVRDTKSGHLTKTADAALQAAVDAVTTYGPVTITLTSATDPERTYTVTTGTDTYLPLGRYTATATMEGSRLATTPLGDAYTEACAKIEQTVDITPATKTVTLNSVPTCYALVLDRTTTTSYRLDYNYLVDVLSIYTGEADIRVAFIKPNGGNISAAYLLAGSIAGGEKQYGISWGTGTGGTHLEVGRWYCFPAATQTSDPATISIVNGTFAPGYTGN